MVAIDEDQVGEFAWLDRSVFLLLEVEPGVANRVEPQGLDAGEPLVEVQDPGALGLAGDGDPDPEP